MRSERVGTRSWVKATGGALRPRDRVAILCQAAVAMGGLPAEILGRNGLIAGRDSVFHHVTASVVTDATERADALCSGLSPAFLQSHSRRTYSWARILAALDNVPVHEIDDEMLYVSSLLHDLGLATAPPSSVKLKCFTLRGAQTLRDIATAAGWDEERIRRGEEAIALHVNPRVPARGQIEAHLLSRGSQLDAVGIGMWRVSFPDRGSVFGAFPPDPDQRRGFSELFDGKRHAPKSRARMYSYLGSRWWYRFGP
jgi:hypothetical protein